MPLKAAKIDELIRELAELREKLAPMVPLSIFTGDQFMASAEPEWKVSQEAREDGRALLIRHPGLGWIAFLIPHQDCARLAKQLTMAIK